MKNKTTGMSIRSRLNLWYTILLCVISMGLLFSLAMTSRIMERTELQQELIRSVERNVDEIEVKDTLLDVESDFAYYSEGIYSIVFDSEGEILGGDYPDGLSFEPPTESGKVQSVDGYYIYDTLIEFSKYEYKIHGVTGEILGSEAEGVISFAPFKGELDFVGKDCVLSGREVYQIALDNCDITASQAVVMSVGSYEYNNAPIYEVEFFSEKKAHDDIWIRGVLKVTDVSSIWGILVNIVGLLLFVLILISSFVGSVITKKAMQPLKLLREEISKTRSGNDLTKRVDIKDSDPEIQRLSDNFNEMLRRLQMSFEAERQFSSDASHELRTPTAVILAECEYHLTRDELDGEDREGFEDIMKQAQSIKSIISQLQYFTKLEQGREMLNRESVDLSELVSGLCDDLSMLDSKGITLTKDIELDINAELDVMMITRLVTNLVSNAYRYGKQGGKIAVTLKKDVDGLIFKVADDGIGIAKEYLDKIWNRFYRVDKARSRDEGCSGLGLAMVRQIALLHGGEVFVESEEGKGSVFGVILR